MIRTEAQRRITLSLVDQGVSSGSNFATGVVVARLAGAAELGEYMLAFTLWVVVLGFHRALITEPLIVATGDNEIPTDALGKGVTAELGLGVLASLLLATIGAAMVLAGTSFGTPVLALSPWLASLLLQDYWRAVCFQRRRPGRALINDVVFAGAQGGAIAAFVVLGWRTSGHIIAAWGLGATAGALVGLGWFRAIARPRGGWELIHRLWPLSRWTLADFSTGFASDQAYLALVAVMLSPSDYGGFRAATSFMGPTIVILHAGSNIGLPEASRRARTHDAAALHRFARSVSAAAFACVAVYGVTVATGGEYLLRRIYGEEFARFAPVVALSALQYIIAVLVFGQGISLKATGRMRLVWRARAVVAVASLTSMAVLVDSWGAIGAGWASTATGLYFALAIYAVYRAELRSLAADAHSPGSRAIIPDAAPLTPERGIL